MSQLDKPNNLFQILLVGHVKVSKFIAVDVENQFRFPLMNQGNAISDLDKLLQCDVAGEFLTHREPRLSFDPKRLSHIHLSTESLHEPMARIAANIPALPGAAARAVNLFEGLRCCNGSGR